MNLAIDVNIGSLWNGSTLSLPRVFRAAYRSVLEANSLMPIASQPRPKDAPVGGHSQEQTDMHFAHAFDGSAARVELVYLNPSADTNHSANLLRTFLAGGSVCLVDVPCGAGAGALVLLTVVAELRVEGQLPKQPLDIRLIWGELSQPAMKYALELLGEVNRHLEEQAIFVTVETLRWDVLDQISNVDLVQKIVQTKVLFPQVLLLVCNFSGFLERQGKWKAAHPGLSLLLQFCSGDMNAGVWIEPDQAAVSEGLFRKLGELLIKLLKFGRVVGESQQGDAASARFFCPLGTGATHRVSARTLPMELAIQRGAE